MARLIVQEITHLGSIKTILHAGPVPVIKYYEDPDTVSQLVHEHNLELMVPEELMELFKTFGHEPMQAP